MDAGMQKHRMVRWLGRLLFVISLVASCGAHAATESVPPLSTEWRLYEAPLNSCTISYTSEAAAAQGAYDCMCQFVKSVGWGVASCGPFRTTIPNPSFSSLLIFFPKDTIIASISFEDYRADGKELGGGGALFYSVINCPAPATYQSILYAYNYNVSTGIGMCVRDVPCLAPNVLNSSGQCVPPTNLTITLSGGTEIQPSTLLSFNAVVKDQYGVVQPGIQVSLTVDVQTLGVQTGAIGVLKGEGGHLHTANRPKGSFACSALYDPGSATPTCTLTTDGNGQAPFIFIPTAVSGTHTITATCNNCTTATAPVNVKVDNLITIPASPLYALSDSNGVIGAIPGKHTDNHYLTETAIGKLGKLAGIYVDVNPGAKLYLNDASLVWGGLFDVGATPWVSPHSLHDKGRSLDIRAANSGPNNEGSVPATLFSKFADTARKKGFNIGLHCKNSTDTNYCFGQPNNRHFHVDF